jgi:DNA-binding XRE family transcriptional regulator
MKQTIAKKLRELRGTRRQKEVAAGIGIKLTTYKALEYGRNEPSMSVLLKLKEFYNLKSVDELLSVSI